MTTTNTPRILLLQARKLKDPAKHEERVSFAQKANLPVSAFISCDLLEGPPTLASAKQYDALMIGGSGDFDVTKRNLPHFQATIDFLKNIVQIGHPMFASCFGFQLLVDALGGQIIADLDAMEVGAYEITLVDDGVKDELFEEFPRTFSAQLGHKERAATLPPGVTNLAYSARAPYQAFRVPGELIWATQFHPELSGEENRGRYFRYLKIYSAVLSEEERTKQLERFTPSPETELLISKFLQLI